MFRNLCIAIFLCGSLLTSKVSLALEDRLVLICIDKADPDYSMTIWINPSEKTINIDGGIAPMIFDEDGTGMRHGWDLKNISDNEIYASYTDEYAGLSSVTISRYTGVAHIIFRTNSYYFYCKKKSEADQKF